MTAWRSFHHDDREEGVNTLRIWTKVVNFLRTYRENGKRLTNSSSPELTITALNKGKGPMKTSMENEQQFIFRSKVQVPGSSFGEGRCRAQGRYISGW